MLKHWGCGGGQEEGGEEQQGALQSQEGYCCTISINSSPRDIFYLSDKSPKPAKIEKKLLPLSAKIGCDV